MVVMSQGEISLTQLSLNTIIFNTICAVVIEDESLLKLKFDCNYFDLSAQHYSDYNDKIKTAACWIILVFL